MIVLVLLYTIALVCFVASNNASSGRSKNAMVCGIVAGYAPHTAPFRQPFALADVIVARVKIMVAHPTSAFI